MTEPVPTLIFVYNADGGALNALADMAHKIISPATYPCSLCALTYGPFSMRRAWRRFLGTLGHAKLFFYRDEFRSELDGRNLPLPAILAANAAGDPEVVVHADELNALANLEVLMTLLTTRLRERG